MNMQLAAIQPRSQERDYDDIDEAAGDFILPAKISNVAYSLEKKDNSW